jgi:DNA-binding winged helix-turn-helix (wHTH) protein
LDSSLKNPEINFNSVSELPSVCEFGEFELHVGPRLLLKDGQQLPVRPKAVATLCVLAAQSGQVVTKDELMQKVWPDAVVEDSNLAQYLHVLRKTLGTMPDGRPYVETLKGRGYRLNAPVRSSSGNSRNGHDRVTGIPTPADVSQSQTRSTKPIPFVVGAFVIVACIVAGLFVAKTTGWFERNESAKTVSDVIVTPLTSGENVTQTTISHDGKFFVYSDFDGDISRLVLQAVDRSSRSEILPRFAGQISNLSFTPDDTQIYFVVSGIVAGAEGLYRISVKGGAPVRLLETITSSVSFSADGSKMVFV